MTDLATERDKLTDRLKQIVGAGQVLTAPDVRAGYEQDWTGRFGGPCRAVVRPADTEQVAAVLKACAGAGVPVIPQGGNTGLVGGSVPAPHAKEPPVILSLTRLDQIQIVDEAASQVTVGAGATLARVQEAARAKGLEFPVDLAARDSATIGGMTATNAGGLYVVRYGAMRSQVLGVEAVLADGRIIRRLDGLVKDNTGYDLSQMLVGSEGTLAVITAARVKLVPVPAHHATAMLGLADVSAALEAATAVRKHSEGLQAIEIFFEQGVNLVGLPDPLPAKWPTYLLVECAGRQNPTVTLIEALADLGLPETATALAEDAPGRARLWAYRERHTEAINALGVPHKLDVTLPAGRLPEFAEKVRKLVADTAPGSTLVLFGHFGDGNLHANIVGPPPEDEVVDEAVFRLVADLGGSISAEHGIGRAKAPWLHLTRTNDEIGAMRHLKAALDPNDLLNPGAILESDGK